MREQTYEYGFIGMGNMGYGILSGLLASHKPETMVFAEKGKARREEIEKQTGVKGLEDHKDLGSGVNYLVLAIKPQQFDPVVRDLGELVVENQIVISIAPGITVAQLQEKLGGGCRIVRAMPNTPALVGEGMTGVCFDQSQFDEQEQKDILELFQSFGKVEVIDEKLMNAVVCVSGSSPAYVYLFIEAMADSAVKYGLARDQAYRMAAQTVLGSAKMVLETGEHPGKLKDQVCSPGGTTIAGVAALEEFGFRNAVIKAADACYEKCGNIK